MPQMCRPWWTQAQWCYFSELPIHFRMNFAVALLSAAVCLCFQPICLSIVMVLRRFVLVKWLLRISIHLLLFGDSDAQMWRHRFRSHPQSWQRSILNQIYWPNRKRTEVATVMCTRCAVAVVLNYSVHIREQLICLLIDERFETVNVRTPAQCVACMHTMAVRIN